MNCSKNLVFTVTHGRTGTTFLTEAFKLFDDTLSLHEPAPNYADILPRVKQDPRHALGFLREKLARIEQIKESHYVETSNVFGKGFLIPLMRLGIRPGLIFLNRNFRKTANSLFQRGSTPMRSRNGHHYSADPRAPGSLPIHHPEGLSDYQLCFWGVLDAYARQRQAERLFRQEGDMRYCWATVDDFHDYDRHTAIGETFGLRVSDVASARARHREIIGVHHNPNQTKQQKREVADYNNEEIEVLDRVAFYDPEFTEAALKSGFLEITLTKAFGLA